MRRWEFVTFLGGGLAAWLLVVPAPAQTVPVIGFLNTVARDQFVPMLTPFHQGLGEVGYVEGRNVAIEYRWAEGQYDRLPALAADLVQRKVAVIVATGGGMSARAAKSETATIPILFVSGADPVHLGLVESLGPVPRNATGVNLHTTLLAAKRLEFLRELAPGARTVALLVNPGSPSTDIETRDIGAATRDAGLELIVLKASADGDFAPAFAAAVEQRADTLLVSADPFFTSRRAQLVALAARHALPAVYPWRKFVEAGGLISYGPRLSEAYREIGRYAGRILKGATPSDLPIATPRRFELVVNLRTAKALGLTVPPLLLTLADEVIE